MGSTPSTNLRRRIRALFGGKRKAKMWLFLDDLPHRHLRESEEAQHSLADLFEDATVQPDYAPSTSAAGRDPPTPEFCVLDPGDVQRSCSLPSLSHWTTRTLCPLEKFYLAYVAPYDVASEKEGVPGVSQDLKGRREVSKDNTVASLPSLKSDTDLPVKAECNLEKDAQRTGSGSKSDVLNGVSDRKVLPADEPGLIPRIDNERPGNSRERMCSEEKALKVSTGLRDTVKENGEETSTLYATQEYKDGEEEKPLQAKLHPYSSFTAGDRSLVVCLDDCVSDVVIMRRHKSFVQNESTLDRKASEDITAGEAGRKEEHLTVDEQVPVYVVGLNVYVNIQTDVTNSTSPRHMKAASTSMEGSDMTLSRLTHSRSEPDCRKGCPCCDEAVRAVTHDTAGLDNPECKDHHGHDIRTTQEDSGPAGSDDSLDASPGSSTVVNSLSSRNEVDDLCGLVDAYTLLNLVHHHKNSGPSQASAKLKTIIWVDEPALNKTLFHLFVGAPSDRGLGLTNEVALYMVAESMYGLRTRYSRSSELPAERLIKHLEQLKREEEECRSQIKCLSRHMSALRHEAVLQRRALVHICHESEVVGSNPEVKKLEPVCYRKYVKIRTPVDAAVALSYVRKHIQALTDLEILICRKQFVLLHVFPSVQQEQVSPSKQTSRPAHKVPKSKRSGQSSAEQAKSSAEQAKSSAEQAKGCNIVIEVVSPVPEASTWSNELTSTDSLVTISTLLSVSNETATATATVPPYTVTAV